MHIPDGFLDSKTWVSLWGISSAAVITSGIKAKKTLGEKHIPLMGVMSAFVFAAQMINIPVAGGTSGHFLGAATVCIALGFFPGIIVMSTVITFQCLIFQDGGITALGANIFNMGVIAGIVGWSTYKLLHIKNSSVAAFIAGYLSVITSSILCSVELAISGTVPVKIVLPAMVGVHALIGIIEGTITAGVIGFIKKVRPDLIQIEQTAIRR